jgi:flagellar basal body L-ring protein FlgH
LKKKKIQLYNLYILKTLFLLFFFILFSFSQDLFKSSDSIYSDEKVLPRGSIIRITFDEQLVINYSGSIQKQIASENKNTQLQSEYFSFLPGYTAKKDGKDSSDSTVTSTRDISGTISATISDYDAASKTYGLRAITSITADGKAESLIISGRANSRDIKNYNVSSSDMAGVSFNFSGITISSAKKASVKDFKSLKLTSGTNAQGKPAEEIELTEERKKELFLEYFTIMLNELF